MYRILLLAFVLGVSCGRQETTTKTGKNSRRDTTRMVQAESFDLQVKKYEDPKRQTWQDPKFVIEALGDLSNKTIADIGSGTGYFTFQMAVPANKVIALDIEQRFLNYIEDRKTEMYDRALAQKIETRLTAPDKPNLQDAEVDVVLMVNTIAYIQNRDEYLMLLSKGLTALGRIIIVDYKEGKMPVGPDDNVKVNLRKISSSLSFAGFEIDKIDTVSLQYQYLIKAHKLD